MSEIIQDNLIFVNEIERLSGAETQGPTSFHEYMFLNKRFGGADPRYLIDLGDAMVASSMPHVLCAAGSAAREGVLFLPSRTEDSIDTLMPDGQRVGDLQKLDEAQRSYDIGVEYGWQQLENGANDPDYQVSIIEGWWESAYGNVYKDLICGEVTAQTLGELGERVRRIARYASKMEIVLKQQSSLTRLSGKLLLALSGLQQPEPALFLPAPRRSSRRHRMNAQGLVKQTGGGANTASVYDLVLFQPDAATGQYRPVVPVQLRGIKNVRHNPAAIMVVGMRTGLGIDHEGARERLIEVGRSHGRLRILDGLWAAASAQLPQYKHVLESFPDIHTPAYTHARSEQDAGKDV